MGLSELWSSDISLSTITGEKLNVVGTCLVSVVYDEKTCVYMLQSPKLQHCWGEVGCQEFKLTGASSNLSEKGSQTDQLLHKYSSLFDGQLGRVAGIEAGLDLREGAQPKFYKPRVVPAAV